MDDMDATQTHPEIWPKLPSPDCSRIIEEEMGGVTYLMQYTTDSRRHLENIIRKMQPRFREEQSCLEIKCLPLEQN
jgi:hypothetical protein